MDGTAAPLALRSFLRERVGRLRASKRGGLGAIPTEALWQSFCPQGHTVSMADEADVIKLEVLVYPDGEPGCQFQRLMR